MNVAVRRRKQAKLVDGGKACTRCGTFYADMAEGFARQESGLGGFVSRCKTCIRETATRPTVERTCKGCGETFMADLYNLRHGEKGGFAAERFCSRECFAADRRDPANHVRLSCVRCGKGFQAWRSAEGRKYCSPECAGIKADPVAVKCGTCGELFHLLPGKAKIRQFCSRACSDIAATTSQQPPEKTRLGKKAWLRLRAEIIRRDGGTCQRCGATVRLHVHHIIPWPETRDDSPDNLLTVCASCHPKVERSRMRLSGGVPSM